MSIAPEGMVWSSSGYLMDWLPIKGERNNSWVSGDLRLVASEFGDQVAEDFKNGAIGYWRQFKPQLRSEGVGNPNSVPRAIIYGLYGLEYEANLNKGWPANLTSEEATLACRYALWELNGFPSWLPRLYENFPAEVETLLIHEINWEFCEYKGETESHYVLSEINHNGDWIKQKLRQPILELIERCSPKHDTTFIHALGVVLQSEYIDVSALLNLAREHTSSEENRVRMIHWLGIWMCLEAEKALEFLINYLRDIKDGGSATEFAMLFLASLLGSRHNSISSNYRDYMSTHILLALHEMMHKYIRIEDDIIREGGEAYSPKLRDDAQGARDRIFNLITEIPGKASYLAILKIARSYPTDSSRPWLVSRARVRAEKDADINPWTSKEIKDFSEENIVSDSNTDIIDFKPNISGIGINFNEIWRRIKRKFSGD